MGKKVVITGAWDYSGPDQAEMEMNILILKNSYFIIFNIFHQFPCAHFDDTG